MHLAFVFSIHRRNFHLFWRFNSADKLIRIQLTKIQPRKKKRAGGTTKFQCYSRHRHPAERNQQACAGPGRKRALHQPRQISSPQAILELLAGLAHIDLSTSRVGVPVVAGPNGGLRERRRWGGGRVADFGFFGLSCPFLARLMMPR